MKKHLTLADRLNVHQRDTEAGPRASKVVVFGVGGHRDHAVALDFLCGRDGAVCDVGVADVVTGVLSSGDAGGGGVLKSGTLKVCIVAARPIQVGDWARCRRDWAFLPNWRAPRRPGARLGWCTLSPPRR